MRQSRRGKKSRASRIKMQMLVTGVERCDWSDDSVLSPTVMGDGLTAEGDAHPKQLHNSHPTTSPLLTYTHRTLRTSSICSQTRQLTLPTADVVQNRHAHAHRGQHRRPSWLLFHPLSARQPLPLPRGPSQQLALQPLDQVLRRQILGLHGCGQSHPFLSGLTNHFTATGFFLPFGVAGTLTVLIRFTIARILTNKQSGNSRRTNRRIAENESPRLSRLQSRSQDAGPFYRMYIIVPKFRTRLCLESSSSCSFVAIVILFCLS